MNEDLYLWYHGDDEGGIGFFNSMPGIEHVWGFIGQDAEMVECINWIDSVCAASTDSTTTTINNDLSQNFKLSTVPNQLNIHSSIESTIEVNIYNINGQYVYKNTHQSNLIEVNTSSFTNGTYIVEILSDQQIVARNKVIITN
jgi:hypothetical protein